MQKSALMGGGAFPFISISLTIALLHSMIDSPNFTFQSTEVPPSRITCIIDWPCSSTSGGMACMTLLLIIVNTYKVHDTSCDVQPVLPRP